MALPVIETLRGASPRQVARAADWTAARLHVPVESVTDDVAVAYVIRHYRAGRLEGWDGFLEDLGV